MSAKIQIRRDTAANWLSTNPILAQGEPGLEIDTNKVKYGDGTTRWNLLDYASGGSGGAGDYSTSFSDGVNDNTWHFVEINGKKEFTFETEGFKLIEITLTTSQVADILNGNLTFDVADIPQMANVWWNVNTAGNGNLVYLYLKADYDSNVFNSFYSSMTNPSTGIYVFNNAPVPFAAGDKIVLKYWSEGTTYTGSYYDSYDGLMLDATSNGATNTVTFDTNEYPYMPWSAFLNPTNVTKHAIIFTQGGVNESRNVTAVTDLGGNIYQVTFDGAAKQTDTPTETTFTFTAPASESVWQLTIPAGIRDTFGEECHYGWMNSNTSKYTGGVGRSGWFTINGGSPINFWWYNNRDNEHRAQLNLPDYTAFTQGDTIQVHFYKQLTVARLDIFNPNTNNWNNGYKWFDWKDDIATEYSPGQGNGIVSGKCQFLMKAYVAEDNGTGVLAGEFGYAALGNYQQNPYDPYRRDYMSNWGDSGNYSTYPFYQFNNNGIVFWSNNTTNGSFSRTMKVRIMYKHNLTIGEEDYGWFNC